MNAQNSTDLGKTKLDELGLSVRARKVLQGYNNSDNWPKVETVAQLAEHVPESYLRRQSNCGVVTIKELNEAISVYGFRLRKGYFAKKGLYRGCFETESNYLVTEVGYFGNYGTHVPVVIVRVLRGFDRGMRAIPEHEFLTDINTPHYQGPSKIFVGKKK